MNPLFMLVDLKVVSYLFPWKLQKIQRYNSTISWSKFSATKPFFDMVDKPLVRHFSQQWASKPLFHSYCDSIITRKILLVQPIFHHKWKSEGTKSEICGGCGRMLQPSLSRCLAVSEVVLSLKLLYCKRKFVVFSALTQDFWDST